MEISSRKPFHAVLAYRGAADPERYAFEQLGKYLKKSVNVFLAKCNDLMPAHEFEIIIGKTARSEDFCETFGLAEDGYYIVCRGGKLYLGGRGRGVIYAVFSFLEQFAACRFFAPDEEYIPKLDAIEIPEGYEAHFSPVFSMRDVLWSTNFDIDWSVKQKINRGHYRNFFGGTGGEKGFAGYFGHTLGELAETGYDAPEPCLTDERIYRTVVKNVRALLTENPGAAFVSVSQNDDFRVCTCEKCAAVDGEEESHAGTMIRFVNRVAEALEGEFPGVLFHTFAYQYTRRPPKYARPRHNVVVQLCPIECCAGHSVATCDSPTPAPWAEMVSERSFREDFLGWAEISPALQIWDYTTDFHHYFAPFPNLYSVRDNVRFYAAHRVTGVLLQGNINTCHSGEFAELKAYLMAKLLWDPSVGDEAYDALIDEFLRHYYGEGWRFIREYIDGLHEICKDRHFGIYYHPLKILPAEEGLPFMLRAKEMFSRAEAAALRPACRMRVKRSAVQVEYYLLLAQYGEEYEKGDEASRARYVNRNRAFYEFIVKNGIYMNPDKPLPKDVDFTKAPDTWHKLG
jgi:hypothetical protein